MADEGIILTTQSDEESDHNSEISAGPQLEPRRPYSAGTHIYETPTVDIIDSDEDSAPLADSHPTLCGRRGLTDNRLERRPFVVRYPGQVIGGLMGQGERDRVRDHRQSVHANASYELEITQDERNPYAPFASQLDWEIAKWAKLRGPGSTAFGELMAIPGVCTSLSSIELLVR